MEKVFGHAMVQDDVKLTTKYELMSFITLVNPI